MKKNSLFFMLIVLIVIILAFVVSISLFKDSELTKKYVEAEGEYVNFSNSGECVEDWNCSDWGPCISYVKKRVCVDQNACSDELSKIEIEVCSYSGKRYYEVNKTINDSGENSFSPEDLDSNFDQVNYSERESLKEESIEVVDCGSSENYFNSCFLEELLDCSPSIILGSYSQDLGGAFVSITSEFILDGFSEEVCLFSELVKSVNFYFSEDYVSQLLEEGYSQEEISEQENYYNEELSLFVNTWIQCGLEVSILENIFEEWMQGILDSGSNCYFNNLGQFLCDFSGDFNEESCSYGLE